MTPDDHTVGKGFDSPNGARQYDSLDQSAVWKHYKTKSCGRMVSSPSAQSLTVPSSPQERSSPEGSRASLQQSSDDEFVRLAVAHPYTNCDSSRCAAISRSSSPSLLHTFTWLRPVESMSGRMPECCGKISHPSLPADANPSG